MKDNLNRRCHLQSILCNNCYYIPIDHKTVLNFLKICKTTLLEKTSLEAMKAIIDGRQTQCSTAFKQLNLAKPSLILALHFPSKQGYFLK